MKKIFTFLVAFLTTVSGAVWAETNPSGTSETSPYDLATRGGLEITDDGVYYVYSSSETNNGIMVDGSVSDHSNPTIHLVGININVGGTAIHLKNYSNPTFIITGENKITSQGSDAAIKVYGAIAPGASFTVDESSTGILDIEMTGNNSNVAIGDRESLAGTMADCGSVTINGGTIKTNGNIGEFDQHAFRFGGNAIVIANNIEGFNYNAEERRSGGLLFLNGDTPYVGEFHNAADDPEFTLSSPLPEPYKIELRQDGVMLEIGPDQTLNESQLVDDGGQVKGYKVTYSSSKIDDVTTAELPTTKFVGSNYKVEAWEDQAKCEPSTVYTRVDQWMLDDDKGSSWISAGSAVGALGDYTTLSNIPTKNYQAVWYLQTKSININLTGEGKFAGSFALWYPAEPEMLFSAEEQTSGALADAGLKISEDDRRMISGLDAPLTITEGTHEVKLNLTPSVTTNAPTGLTTTLTVEVNIDALDLSDDTEVKVTLGANDNLTYDGKNKEIDIDVNNAANNQPIAERYYSVVFKKQTAEGQYAEEELSEICDAGTYKVIVKANKGEEGQVLVEDSQKEAGTVTIKPAILTAKAGEVNWNIKDGGTPAYKDAEFTLETIYSVGETKDDVSINTSAEGFTASPTGDTWQTTPGRYTVNYSGLALTGSRAFNYTLDPATAEGKLVVSVEGSKDDPIDDDGEDPLITGAGDWADGTTYDGVEHPLEKIMVTYGEEEKEIAIPSESIEYSYLPIDAEEGTASTSTDEVKNAGTYTATFTFPDNEYGYKGTGKVSLTIGKATLTATTTDAMPQIGVGESLEDINISSKDATQYIKFEGLQNNEVAAYTGTLKANKDLDTSTEGELENAYTVDVTLAPEGTFDPNNYTTPSYDGIKVSAVVGKITINPGGDGEGGEEGDDVIGGEDTDDDGNFPSEGDFILISPDGEECSVYDGQPHELKILQIGDYTLKVNEDYTVTSYGTTGNPKNAGTYTATIELVADGKYQLESGEITFDLIIHIAQRPVTVDFGKFPASIDIDTETLDASQYAIWQKEDEVANEGLVDDEEPIYEGTLVLTPSEEYPEYFNVYLDRETFKVEDNDPFFVNNYTIYVYDEKGEKWIKLEENEDGDATLPEGEDDPLVDTPDEEGGIEIEDGSSTSGGGYYQDWNDLIIYESEGATLKSRYDKMRVKDGGKFTLSLTIDEAYAGAEPVVYYRRGRGGDWTPLKISINGLYHVDNVYTDIYVKVMGDGIWVVGNEDITATDARAYAQPNKIVVITPQPTDVQIISMAGAVVATDKVMGQREFANLTEGVYIVRMGETVVKLQVRK